MNSERDRTRLREVAVALAELADELVFVGGGVTALLLNDPAAPPTRFSYDVDAVMRATKRTAYLAVAERLRELGFKQRPAEPVICRWFLGELIVDVMPDDPEILGFTNRWYSGAFDHAVVLDIDGVKVRVVSAPWFLATKLEAFTGRGNGDYLGSRDIEDIVAVIDGRDGLVDEVRAAPEELRIFLEAQFATLLREPSFVTSIVGHVAGESQRAEIVIDRLREIARAE